MGFTNYTATQAVEAWLVNDADYYAQAQEIAQRCIDTHIYTSLEDWVICVLNDRATVYTQEMRAQWDDHELALVDWIDLARTLVAE